MDTKRQVIFLLSVIFIFARFCFANERIAFESELIHKHFTPPSLDSLTRSFATLTNENVIVDSVFFALWNEIATQKSPDMPFPLYGSKVSLQTNSIDVYALQVTEFQTRGFPIQPDRVVEAMIGWGKKSTLYDLSLEDFGSRLIDAKLGLGEKLVWGWAVQQGILNQKMKERVDLEREPYKGGKNSTNFGNHLYLYPFANTVDSVLSLGFRIFFPSHPNDFIDKVISAKVKSPAPMITRRQVAYDILLYLAAKADFDSTQKELMSYLIKEEEALKSTFGTEFVKKQRKQHGETMIKLREVRDRTYRLLTLLQRRFEYYRELPDNEISQFAKEFHYQES